jgi:hypothetical protein
VAGSYIRRDIKRGRTSQSVSQSRADEDRDGPRNVGYSPFKHLKRLVAQENFIECNSLLHNKRSFVDGILSNIIVYKDTWNFELYKGLCHRVADRVIARCLGCPEFQFGGCLY